MNTISTIGQTLAMDGHSFKGGMTAFTIPKAREAVAPMKLPQTAAEVSRTLADNLAEAKETCQNIQKLSDLVLGHKLQFSVNEKLNKVIVEVVDPSTNQIIREIPSEDMQRIQIQMKQAIGVLFDEMI